MIVTILLVSILTFLIVCSIVEKQSKLWKMQSEVNQGIMKVFDQTNNNIVKFCEKVEAGNIAFNKKDLM